jgi:AcrR family transcriptional regulator
MRSRLIEAAWQAAEENGVNELTLRDLARRVGMRAPSLYEYVASKRTIYDLMFADGYQALITLFEQLPRTGDDRSDLLVGLQQWLDFCQASLPRYQLMFTRVVPAWEPSAEAYAVSELTWQQMTDRFVDLGLGSPELLDLWTSLASGLAAQQAANAPDGDRYRRLAPAAVDMFLQHTKTGVRR